MIHGTPPIVTNGLVLALDAANQKSYTSGSTIWNDLSGNGNSGSLTNGPAFSSANGGSIVFDGIDDYVLLTPMNPANFTCDITFDSTTVAGYIIRKFQYGWGLFVNSAGILAVWVDTDANHRATTKTFSYSGITNVIISFGNSVINVYRNGILVATTSTPTNSVYSPSDLSIRLGTDSGGVGFINGKIYSTKIYNKALSAQEVQQNYNAQKSRFNLI
jgi:hypothetical protein